MASVPIPTVAEAGQGAAWFTTQAGIVATVLAVICITMIFGIVFLFRNCKKEMESAWARVTVISEARSADARAGDEALNKNTLALTILNERLNNKL